MKKLSKIRENLWANLQDRSSGEVIRKEDDINLLKPDGFVEYIQEHYKIISDDCPINIANYATVLRVVRIPFCLAGSSRVKIGVLDFDYEDDVVTMFTNMKFYVPELWKKLNDNFDICPDDVNNYIIINPKDTKRKVDNSYVLEVLDFIIDNLDSSAKPVIFKQTNENLWADLQDRSSGEVLRREDKDYINYINNLNFEEFYDYIDNTYHQVYGSQQIMNYHPYIISIPIEEEAGPFIHLTYVIRFANTKDCDKIYVSDIFKQNYPKEFEKLAEDYTIEEKGRWIPKKGKLTNWDCIYLLDKLLSIVKKPMLKK